MPRSERERREDLAPTTEAGAASPEVVAPVPAAVLRMQSTIGNRATGEILARAPEKAAVKDGVSFAGLGDYKIHSDNLVSTSTVHVTFDAGNDAPKFFSAAQQGKSIATVTITHAGHSITLSEVLIASVQSSGAETAGPVLSVELNAGAIKFD